MRWQRSIRLDGSLHSRSAPDLYMKPKIIMRLLPLFLSAALAVFSSLAGAQMAEPFSPPGGLHPHQQRCAQQEIVSDNALPQYENSENASLCCSDLHA